MDITDQIVEFLTLSENVRPGYPESIGYTRELKSRELAGIGEIPRCLAPLYQLVDGTPATIQDQRMMDFIPGFRLVHYHEYREVSKALNDLNKGSEDLVSPFLVNYSNDHICFSNSRVVSLNHDAPWFVEMHESLELFFKTCSRFYTENVFFLSDDGFLDSTFEQEGTIGRELNPGALYWCE